MRFNISYCSFLPTSYKFILDTQTSGSELKCKFIIDTSPSSWGCNKISVYT